MKVRRCRGTFQASGGGAMPYQVDDPSALRGVRSVLIDGKELEVGGERKNCQRSGVDRAVFRLIRKRPLAVAALGWNEKCGHVPIGRDPRLASQLSGRLGGIITAI